MSVIYSNEHLFIKVHSSEIPWLKIYSQQACKEFSECDETTRQQIWQLLGLVEREMITYFKPEKINIASFGNYKPQVHWHVMARFAEDSYYPESMWGTKQREAVLEFPSMSGFLELLLPKIDDLLQA